MPSTKCIRKLLDVKAEHQRLIDVKDAKMAVWKESRYRSSGSVFQETNAAIDALALFEQEHGIDNDEALLQTSP